MIRVAVAVFVGLLIGYERQRKGKPVGMLTGVIVVVGTVLYVTAGAMLSPDALGNGDPTRLASLIITGIGFIGAGTIMRSKFSVTGLASAATIWSLGGIGILIAWGFVITATGTALVLAALLRGVPQLEHWVFRGEQCLHADIVVEKEALVDVLAFLSEHGISPAGARVAAAGELQTLAINECGLEGQRHLLSQIGRMQGVRRVTRRST